MEQSLSARSLAPPPELIASLGCLGSQAPLQEIPVGSPPAHITPFWLQQPPDFLGAPHLGQPEAGTMGDTPSWMIEPEVNSQAQCPGQPGIVPRRQAGPCLLPPWLVGADKSHLGWQTSGDPGCLWHHRWTATQRTEPRPHGQLCLERNMSTET